MNIVSGAVNTVIVCMAEMPDELQANHPKYSQAMRCGWLKAFPSCGLKYDVVVQIDLEDCLSFWEVNPKAHSSVAPFCVRARI